MTYLPTLTTEVLGCFGACVCDSVFLKSDCFDNYKMQSTIINYVRRTLSTLYNFISKVLRNILF
jgi:hypothetical protein